MQKCSMIGLVLCGLGLVEAGEPKVVSLQNGDLGKKPSGWAIAKTGEGEGSDYRVTSDPTAPSKAEVVLTQTAQSPRNMFNLCVVDAGSHENVEVSVSFKALKGNIDQGGGIVWRYQDAKNYYVARMNPKEENFRLYRIIDGDRKQLQTAEVTTVKPNKWHTLTIKHVGENIECSLDGKKLLEAKDNTISKAGKVGLWTKADAMTSFDRLAVTDLPK